MFSGCDNECLCIRNNLCRKLRRKKYDIQYDSFLSHAWGDAVGQQIRMQLVNAS